MPDLIDHELPKRFASGPSGVLLGHVARISPEGDVFVDFPGNESDPVIALVVDHGIGSLRVDDRVALAFEPENRSCPIVLGAVRNRLQAKEGEALIDGKDTTKAAIIDGKTIRLTGKEEVVLRCGKSSITLRKDGKIVIKGTDLVSRATRSNKIKGGSVGIN